MVNVKFLLVGRYQGANGALEHWFSPIGAPPGLTVTADVTASDGGSGRVGIRIRVRSGGAPVAISNPHVSVGAFERSPASGDRFDRVGRAPVLEPLSGAGSSTITFDVLPGYLDRSPSEPSEFTFVAVGEVELDAPQGEETSRLGRPDPSRRATAATRAGRPEVVAVVELDGDGVPRSVDCSHPDFAVDAHGERVSDDPRDGRPRTRVVFGGLGELRPEVELSALDRQGRPTTAPVELAPGSLEFNALTVRGARDADGSALGLRLTVRGEARHRRGGLA